MSLQRGSKGEEVRALQEMLKEIGLYRGPLDGDFGRGSFAAVRAFQQRYFVDGIADDTTIVAVEAAGRAWRVDPASISVPDGLAEINNVYGLLEVQPDPVAKWGKDAWVTITNDWAVDYLVEVDLPIVGTHKINKMIKSSLISVLETIISRGLDGEIKQFGCHAPRHKMHNRNRGLSIHAWAAAIDLNWDTNGVGAKGDLDPGIVQAFEVHGWVWGGRWRTRDDMHFQLATGY